MNNLHPGNILYSLEYTYTTGYLAKYVDIYKVDSRHEILFRYKSIRLIFYT